MPLQATSGAASYDAFGGGAVAVPQYIEDVFNTYLYTGNDTTQVITNGIDLATKGGLVWNKGRDAATNHILVDTARGTSSGLITNVTDAAGSSSGFTSFDTTGFTFGGGAGARNNNGTTYCSWTFRKQPKFFDVVTWTGDGAGNRLIPHNLGSVPGCFIFRAYSGAANWIVYHQALGISYYGTLNSTEEFYNNAMSQGLWTQAPSSTNLYIDSNRNASGVSYIAYIFAHDAGGFGLTGTDNVISCGSFTTDGSGKATVTLGYEPQWLLIKPTNNSTQDWRIVDSMRGFTVDSQPDAVLNPNLSSAEGSNSIVFPTATGFGVNGLVDTTTWIYIAIRRGPMKVPTSGTSVFNALLNTGTDTAKNVTGTGWPVDLAFTKLRNASGIDVGVFDRLRGVRKVFSSAASAESTGVDAITGFDVMNGMAIGVDSNFALTNRAPNIYVYECFRRAPSFFDEVCYTGTGVARTVTHNLAAVPELMIIKSRTATWNWAVYHSALGNTQWILLDSDGGPVTQSNVWNNTSPTSSVFTVGSYGGTNASAGNYVAYLFATLAGVSKVGSYTGTGTTLQIDCGFTGGARFVLIKRSQDGFSGDWYVWDSARGIVSGNDPYLLLNSTAAEVTSTDYIDTYSAGFEISSTAPSAINASGGSFIFLAIA
jgi:hypothetical protein